MGIVEICGAPDRTRTDDLRFRKPLLCPTELPGLVQTRNAGRHRAKKLVEIAGLEPATSALRTPRSPN